MLEQGAECHIANTASIAGLLPCSAWLYLPDGLAEDSKVPAIVMAHGFSGVKEQFLDRFAERFVAAGFVTLVFNYRYFGGSEGQPRGQLFPLEQVEDYRNAVTWLSEHPQVDPGRVGAWGTSFSGGLVFHLSVFDRRIKATVAQVPSVLNYENRRARDPEKQDQFAQFLPQDRVARHRTGVLNYLKVVAPEGEPCVLSGQESYQTFMALSEDAPTWLNGVTVESLERIQEFDPTRFIHLIAPTPLLIIGAEHDSLIPAALVTDAFDRAREPKRIVMLPCRHFDVYGTEPLSGVNYYSRPGLLIVASHRTPYLWANAVWPQSSVGGGHSVTGHCRTLRFTGGRGGARLHNEPLGMRERP